MIKPSRVIIIGAGPAGLAAALALSQQSTAESPIHVTILELRDAIQTLGGAINLTPLALRYLDSIGVAERVRAQAAKCNGIDIVAHRTGGLLGTMWEGRDAVRVSRQAMVEAMMEKVNKLPNDRVDVIFGVSNLRFNEFGDPEGDGGIRVIYNLSSTGRETSLEGDALLGCDGLHSVVRSSYVDPHRKKTYSSKCAVYGYADISSLNPSTWKRPDGKPLVADTSLLSQGNDAFLLSYFEPVRDKLYLSAVMPRSEPEDGSREGWAVEGADKEGLKNIIARPWVENGNLAGMREIIEKCEEWFFFPVYMLPPGGVWAKGRTLLLGDAAHAMPPQGESTGVAIEDGILFAHVFSRRATRSVSRMIADYEALRRTDIDTLYRETVKRWTGPLPEFISYERVVEWVTWLFLKAMSFKKDYFSRDVRKLELPE